MKKTFLIYLFDGKEPTYRIYKTLDTHYVELTTDIMYLDSTLDELSQINKNFFNSVNYLKIIFSREYYLCNSNYQKIINHIQNKYITNSCSYAYNILEDV